MSTERLDIVIREDGSRTVKRNIADIGKEATIASQGVKLLQTAMLGLTVGAGLVFLQRQADAYTNLQNRLRLVTKGSIDLKQVNDELFASANRTRSEYEATAELYASLARSTKALGVSQKDLLGITESINQAVKISGTEAATAANGLRQLGQGLASGTLRGDELNSVLENMPRLAQAIADGMGKSLGELRKLGAEGKITARDIIQSVRAAAPALEAEFKKITPTISDSFVVLRNNVLKFIGETNNATGVSLVLSRAIILLSTNLDVLVKLLAVAATAFALWRASLAVSAVMAYIRGLMAMQLALGATAAQAFTTGVAMRGLKAAMAFLSSGAFLGGLAIAGVATALVALASDAASANATLAGLEDSGKGAAMELIDMEAKARAAGMQVDSLTGAAASANPIIAAIAKRYGGAADEAKRLAINARLAAIAVAQGKISELTAKRDVLNENDRRGVANGNMLVGVRATARDVMGELGFGPTRTQRIEGSNRIGNEIGIYQRQIDILKTAPDKFFAPDPIKGGGGGGDPKKKDKKDGGGGGQTRSEFLAQVNRETDNSIRLSGILDENWRQVQEQITGIGERMSEQKWAPLTEAENTALTAKLQTLQQTNELERTRDNLARQFVEPQRELIRTQTAADQLLKAGVITTEQYGRAIDDARLAVLALANDGESGMQAGLILVEREAKDEAGRLAQAIQNIWKGSKGPQLEFEAGMKAADRLLKEGKISADDYARSIRDIRIAYLETRPDAASGLEAGKLGVQRDNDSPGQRVASSYRDAYSEANGELQGLLDRQTALKQLMVDDPINSGQYANQLRVIGAEMQALTPGAGMFDQMRAGLADFVADFKGVLPGLRQAWGSTFQRIGDGVANALSRAIVYGENLGSALKDVARSALQELLAALIKLGIQWLVMSVIGQGAQTAMAATSSATGASVAAAWAPAAAAVSLASFGANAIPASAGIASTYALTTALSMVGKAGAGFRDGGYTGNGGVGEVAGVVHGQEFVMNAEATKAYLPMLEAMNSGRGYKSGGYVTPLGSSAMIGSRGAAVPADAQGNGRGGDLHISIDARGAENGVEEKIEAILEAYTPVILAKARKQEAKVDNEKARQRIGGRR